MTRYVTFLLFLIPRMFPTSLPRVIVINLSDRSQATSFHKYFINRIFICCHKEVIVFMA